MRDLFCKVFNFEDYFCLNFHHFHLNRTTKALSAFVKNKLCCLQCWFIEEIWLKIINISLLVMRIARDLQTANTASWSNWRSAELVHIPMASRDWNALQEAFLFSRVLQYSVLQDRQGYIDIFVISFRRTLLVSSLMQRSLKNFRSCNCLVRSFF